MTGLVNSWSRCRVRGKTGPLYNSGIVR